ncbi:MAG: SBBP repeat-containing protein, partial [Vicinamibacteraceae bacterium]
MAQWLARGTAVVGVVALGWVSNGRGQQPAPPTAAAPQQRASSEPVVLDRGARARVVETLARQPLRFEANAGQFSDGVRFAARGTGYGVALTSTGATLSLASPSGATAAVAMTVVARDGQPAAARRVDGRDQLPGVVNHYIGSDPTRWQVGVGQFARVRETGVYEGIDLEFYGNQERLEYDFLVAPGADPAEIRLRYDGADRLEIDPAGDLLVHAAVGEPLRQQAPISYQVIDGTRREVESRYVRLAAREVGVALGDYDRAHPLTIDPVLIYSSFFGGSSQEYAFDIALDPAGNIYLTGQTTAGTGFPTTPGAYQPTKPGISDAFVTKFNPSGTALIYSTFLGGTNNENTRTQRSGRIATDAAGNAYVA